MCRTTVTLGRSLRRCVALFDSFMGLLAERDRWVRLEDNPEDEEEVDEEMQREYACYYLMICYSLPTRQD
jgi:hypothetical protein